MTKFEYGVLTGNEVQEVFSDAKENNYALPAVNVTSSSTVNSVLEAAAEVNSPVIVQFSAGGCQFFAGKGLGNDCLLYTSPSPRDAHESRMPSSA